MQFLEKHMRGQMTQLQISQNINSSLQCKYNCFIIFHGFHAKFTKLLSQTLINLNDIK